MIKPTPSSGAVFAGLRIGLLGGSFNPAHEGHRAMSLYALKRLGLDQVWWLVSPQNPLKSLKGMASLADRMKGAHAVAKSPRIVVTDLEAQMGTHYTVDSLHILKKRFPRVQFVWLMGADNLEQMPRWHRWENIFRSVPVAVFRRPFYAAGRRMGKAAQRFDRSVLPVRQEKILAQSVPPAWLVMNNPLNLLSATELRHKR